MLNGIPFPFAKFDISSSFNFSDSVDNVEINDTELSNTIIDLNIDMNKYRIFIDGIIVRQFSVVNSIPFSI